MLPHLSLAHSLLCFALASPTLHYIHLPLLLQCLCSTTSTYHFHCLTHITPPSIQKNKPLFYICFYGRLTQASEGSPLGNPPPWPDFCVIIILQVLECSCISKGNLELFDAAATSSHVLKSQIEPQQYLFMVLLFKFSHYMMCMHFIDI